MITKIIIWWWQSSDRCWKERNTRNLIMFWQCNDDEKPIPTNLLEFKMVKPSSSRSLPRQRQRRVQHPQRQWQTCFSGWTTQTLMFRPTVPLKPLWSPQIRVNLLFESGNSVVAGQTAAFRHFKSFESALKKTISVWNKLASLGATLVRNYDLLTHWQG